MKTTFEQELEGKEQLSHRIRRKVIMFETTFYKKDDVLSAKNKTKKQILKEIYKIKNLNKEGIFFFPSDIKRKVNRIIQKKL